MEELKSGDKPGEPKHQGNKPPPCDPEYVRTVKLAAAIAILRTKPAGMTGQQYTQYLQLRYQANQVCTTVHTVPTAQTRYIQQYTQYLQLKYLAKQVCTTVHTVPTAQVPG
ncbi:uncharacterized protein LOC144885517 [Branchiostoma floridae x Branchiostoma japonicum]